MGLFDHFPYTNFHELNLDWILNALRELEHTIDQFVAINALKYADPIQWNIVSQYEKNTIVIDPLTGTAYISVQPVPSGVALTNTDYWTVVFDLGSFVVRAARNFTDKWEPETTLTATFPSDINDWIIWGDVLYRVISPIVAGDQYVDGSNIVHFTAEDVIGHIQDLNTTDKSNLVAAINEVLQTLTDTTGDLDDLDTTDKTNLVASINEIIENDAKIHYYVTPEMFGAAGDGLTNDTAAVQAAIDTGLTVVLKNTYLIDTVSGTNITIIGNGKKLINNGTRELITANSLVIEDVIIDNQAVFDYQSAVLYATLDALDCKINNVTINNVNKIGVRASNALIDKLRVITTFDVENTYDGTDNHLYGLYINHDSSSRSFNIKNSYFTKLIEGIYCSTFNLDTITVNISNCVFEIIGDHALYSNAAKNSAVTYLENNIFRKCTDVLALCGNNYTVIGNYFEGGYSDNVRNNFGFSIRNSSNVLFANNTLKSTANTVTAGQGTAIQIKSLDSDITEMSDILFLNNEMEFENIGASQGWLRIGGPSNYLTDLYNLKFIGNKISIKGYSEGIYTTIAVHDMLLDGNIIESDIAFIDSSVNYDKIITNNTISVDTGSNFDSNSRGTYTDNRFNCATVPIRVPVGNSIYTARNTNSLFNGYCYSALTNSVIENGDVIRGIFTSDAAGSYRIDEYFLQPVFRKKLLLFDKESNIITTATIDLINSGAANITNLTPSTDYEYIIW